MMKSPSLLISTSSSAPPFFYTLLLSFFLVPNNKFVFSQTCAYHHHSTTALTRSCYGKGKTQRHKVAFFQQQQQLQLQKYRSFRRPCLGVGFLKCQQQEETQEQQRSEDNNDGGNNQPYDERTILSDIMRFRGPVDTGYGRGGKKLGFPTANLPSRYFQDALSNITCGVYYGWAIIERRGSNNNKSDEEDNNQKKKEEQQSLLAIHKAVVNVGYSPTFEGQENAEKIIEAHLISDVPIQDFYNETMRLQLHGFLRPEMKFPSFPALIEQITTDVQTANTILDQDEISQQFRCNDEFLRVPCTISTMWIGNDGGNSMASWEFQSMQEWELLESDKNK